MRISSCDGSSQLLNVKTVNFNCATVCLRLANSTLPHIPPRTRGSTPMFTMYYGWSSLFTKRRHSLNKFFFTSLAQMIRFYDSNVLPICAPPVFTRILTFLLWWKCSKQALLCINMRRTENGASATLTPVET